MIEMASSYFARLIVLIVICHRMVNSLDVKCDQTFPSLCFIGMAIDLSIDDELIISPMEHARLVTRFEIAPVSNLKKFPNRIFETFRQIEAVTLNSANIHTLHNTTFDNATNLKELHLKLNKLTEVTEFVFKNAAKLEQLDLSGNEIENIEDKAFGGLQNLRTLKLNGNLLKILRHHTFDDLDNLEYLHLYSNRLETIESRALTLPKLTEIFFGHNRLLILPDDLFLGAPKLEVTEFSDNQLIRIGDAFENCNNIYSLNLENNPIEDIDLLKFAEMRSLSSLSLNNTQFSFPENPPKPSKSLIKSFSLESLNLANNNLSNANIFQHLVIFPELQRLYLYNNMFTEFADVNEIKTFLPKLNTLDLTGNKLIIDWLRYNNGAFKRDEINVLNPRYK